MVNEMFHTIGISTLELNGYGKCDETHKLLFLMYVVSFRNSQFCIKIY